MKAVKTIVVFIFACLPFLISAQINMSFYPVEKQFNSSRYNPAFLTSDGQFLFSFFPLAGTNIGYNNQSEINNLVNKLLSGLNDDDEYIELAKSMVRSPTFYQKLESELLTFTYRSKKGFLNFGIKENISFSASIKGPVSEFMILPEVRSTLVGEVQRIPALILHFREYSLAYSIPQWKNKFTAGIRAKFYFGKSVFSSDIAGAIQNQDDSYFLKTWGKGLMSMPESEIVNDNGTVSSVPSLSGTSVKSYLMNNGNPGFGIDLGIKYKITPKLTFSASIIDFGKITWKTNLNSKNFDGIYNFKPSSINITTNSGKEIISKTADSISFTNDFSNVFTLSYSRSKFSTRLPLTVYTGLSYQINPKFMIHLVDRNIFMKDLNQHTFMATASFEPGKNITINTGISAIGNTFNNVPLAMLLNYDFGQIYLGTDNVLSILTPYNTEFSGLTFGTCFYLFKKRDLYRLPTEEHPYYKPKRLRKIQDNGRILKEYPEYQ
jgi:hypothetical protein